MRQFAVILTARGVRALVGGVCVLGSTVLPAAAQERLAKGPLLQAYHLRVIALVGHPVDIWPPRQAHGLPCPGLAFGQP